MDPIRQILVDAYALGEGSRDRGIGMYLSTVLKGLVSCDDLHIVALATESAELPAGVERRTIKRRLPHRLASWEHDVLLRHELRGSADVAWSPAQSIPSTGVTPLVQTLHDLTPLVFPHPLLETDARRWRRRGDRLRRASAVIAPSRSTSLQAVQYMGLDAKRIHVIPHAASPAFTQAGPRVHRERPYVLLVAAWGPHKGFADAARAMREVARRGLPHQLLVAGPQDSWMRHQAKKALDSSGGSPNRIQLLGFVKDLPSLYRGAEALVMPSRAEGFGLPVLEALACGTPVVSYDNTSLPEVGGDAAVLVPDGAPDLLGSRLADLLEDDMERQRRGELGLIHARRFSWRASVEGHASVFRSVARRDAPTRSPASDQ